MTKKTYTVTVYRDDGEVTLSNAVACSIDGGVLCMEDRDGAAMWFATGQWISCASVPNEPSTGEDDRQ
jgi:hypothetical protein